MPIVSKSAINLVCEVFVWQVCHFWFMSSRKFIIHWNSWNSFAGLKLMNWSKNMSMKFYPSHHIIVISIPLNLSGCRWRGVTPAPSAKMSLEWKLWQICGRNHCSGFVFFVHWLQGKNLQCYIKFFLLLLFTTCMRV